MNNDRRHLELTEEQVERIAVRSAEIVWANFQREVGKGTIRLAIYIIGLAGAAGTAWLVATGKVKL